MFNPLPLQEVGHVAHVAKSGRVIVELASPVRDGTVLYDKRGTRLARVMETIGPVARPFASAGTLTNNISPHVGGSVFAEDEGGSAGLDSRGPRSPPRRAERPSARGSRSSARRPDRRAERTEARGSRSPARRTERPPSRSPRPSSRYTERGEARGSRSPARSPRPSSSYIERGEARGSRSPPRRTERPTSRRPAPGARRGPSQRRERPPARRESVARKARQGGRRR